MKQLFLFGVSLVLCGCGIIGAGQAVVFNDWASEIDISTTENVATIRGGTRQVLVAHVTCVIDKPAKTKKLVFDAGAMKVEVSCHVMPEYTDSAKFTFEAVAGHDYFIRKHVPGMARLTWST